MQKTITPIVSAFLFLFSGVLGCAQQVADTLYNPIVSNPAYENAQGPIVLIDEAHGNFHTLSGRF